MRTGIAAITVAAAMMLFPDVRSWGLIAAIPAAMLSGLALGMMCLVGHEFAAAQAPPEKGTPLAAAKEGADQKLKVQVGGELPFLVVDFESTTVGKPLPSWSENGVTFELSHQP